MFSRVGSISILALLFSLISSATAFSDPKKPLTEEKKKQVCEIVESYGHGLPTAVYQLSAANVCEPAWKDGVPSWEQPENKRYLESSFTGKEIGLTRVQAYARGHRIGTRQELINLVNTAEKRRAPVAAQCCAGNKECVDAMANVGFEFCKRPHDPTKVDPCIKSTGQFNLKTSELYGLIAAIIDAGAIEFSNFDSNEKQLFTSMQKRFPRALINGETGSGFVKLSPYFDKKSKALVDALTIDHELSHACSNIQRQIMLKQPSARKRAAAAYLEQFAANDAECEISNARKVQYVALLAKEPNARQIVDCLAAAAENEQTGLENVCPRKRLEEGYAYAAAYLSSSSQITSTVFPKLCEYYPSRVHPAPSNVMQCLLINSPRYRATFSKAMGCGQ
ncbi:MAG TPA: hypothetical protein VM432_11500 [Bdellovibrionales bacterium]|nr:hypothetical protein [Bdellovibrionales bacterium]